MEAIIEQKEAPTRLPRPRRRLAGRESREEAAWLAVMLLPGLLTAYLGFRSGGFYVGDTSLVAAELALVLGLRFTLSPRPLRGFGKPLIVAVVAMALFVGWTLLSANWSHSVARALPAYSRALLYGLLLFFFGTLPFNPRRIRWLVYGLVAAIVAICVAALIARLLPHTIFDPTLVDDDRLGYPLTYWNALGILACVGTVLCLHLACSTRDAPVARVLGAAAVPLLVVTLYFTLSRGPIWLTPVAVGIYIVVGRPRALLSGLVATLPAAAIALLVAHPSSAVTEGYPHAMVASGRHVAVVVGLCILGAGALRACLLPLDGVLMRLRLPDRARAPVIALSIAACLIAAMGVAAAVDAPHLLSSKYHEFVDRENTGPAAGEARLLSARPETRFELWEVALDSYRADRFHGAGAGSYAITWDRDRKTASQVQNAHSLYLETLAEFGIVGFLLLLVVLLSILGAFAYRARGPNRALFAALLAAGLAWAVHAGVDWDWQMPAVTLWLFACGGAALARSLHWRRRRRRNDLRLYAVRAAGAIACLLLAIVPARLAISQTRLVAAVDALHAGRCEKAVGEANSSLSAVGQRPAPYAVIAFCDMRDGRYGSAVLALQRALARDPESWALNYQLAVARAGAGLNPRSAARRTALLNPEEALARSAPLRFRGRDVDSWKQAAAVAPLLPPGIGDP